ncbi:putative equisetin synthetase [Lindgomyces ingoldianus]|uniref:Equisetin synthetase n=1 Tax=Lindgomyces ingoldianus TaxID=673940 RepID=A0ACB6QZX8_9PLEO|nr:putative equisetin synthetase [Lindgomyces ingoldianus]KAF2471756.1 putative equisetin synthetase [Lindgomyces ingoldianus]
MSSTEPIAIIGSACQFPGGSDTPSKLWELLREPRDLVQKVPTERRFDPAAFYHSDPEHHGTTDVQTSYFLDKDPAEFDNSFFNIQPAESEAIDPQQRMLMETVYDSLCAAGQAIEGLRGSSTAIFVGVMGDDWGGAFYKDWDNLPQYSATGLARSILSNRVSYFFDWHGPSITLDTACSSSLVAVHLAVQALRNGESRVAVAAGANLLLSPATYIAESNLHMLSPNGRSRMWDKDADGYARGEGIAAVVLKPLSAALEDGDHIECIIRATGVNQDGKTAGLTMPSSAAQAMLIRDTYARAGLDINKPEDRPQFFHAHGTGTPAGDPQEAEAISRAFYSGGASDKLYVGSIKTIIGHTEGTAGLASLIGTSLAVQHGIIPPNMHFQQLNPRLKPFYGNLEVPTSAKLWPKLHPGQPRRASVNSFGFGGTNAHAIIEAYEPPSVEPSTGPLFTPLTISAATEKSLRSLLSSYSEYLKSNPQVSIRDFAYTLQARRSTLAYRVAVTASTSEEASEKIDALLASDEAPELSTRHFGVSSPRILAVFTGQGAQWPRMGAKLVESSPFVSKRLGELDEALASLPKGDRPDWTLREELLAEATSSRLAEAALSQPLCTAVQILLVDLLQLAGIKLQAVVGHSSGEIAAAYASGLLSASTAIRVAYYRGLYAKLAKSPNGVKGAMMAVGTSFEDAFEFCQLDTFKGRIQVAARNSSSSITLSGDEDAIAEAVEIFKDEGKFARQLKVDTAYHSEHMLPCSAPYLASMEAIGALSTNASDSRPIWHSSVHDGQVMSASSLDPQYWVSNMTNAVLFAPAVSAAVSQNGPFDLALELGPHPALKGPCLDTLEEVHGERIPYSGLLSRGKDDTIQVSTALGFLWSYLGAGSVAFESFEKSVSGDKVGRNMVPDLPKYPFDHSKSFWTMSRVSGAHTNARSPPHPILGRRCVDRETTHEIQWRNILRPKEIPWLKGHKIQRQIVFPAAGFVAMAAEAMKALAGKSTIALITIENLFIGRAMFFEDENASVESLFSVKVIHSGKDVISAKFSCYSGPSHEPGSLLDLNAEGEVTVTLAEQEADRLPFVEPEDFNMNEVEVDRFYDQLTELQYEYSPPFHGMLSIKRKNGYATGVLENQSGSEWEDQLLIHPGMLDTAIQSALAAFSCPGDGRMWGMYIPVGIQSIVINPYFTPDGTGKQDTHPLEAVVRDFTNARCNVDINIFSEDNAHTFVMLEGMELMPFTAARPDDDTVLFSSFEYKIDGPNGDAAAANDMLTSEDVENAINAERVAFYYLRRLVETITPEQKANTLPHYQHLLRWATHAVNRVKCGKNPFISAKYQLDTEEHIRVILEKDRDRADVRLLESVGKNLPEVVRTSSGILEYMAEDGLFDFYDGGLGLDIANRHFARMVAQVAHRYPRMKILELGAGTGGSTRNILPLLGPSFSSYTYTDISSGFFEAAQDRFSDYANRMIFKTFDMEQSPASQGFIEGSYDLILASNVMHATGKLEEMMSNVRSLLKPGGYLITLELTSDDTLRVGLPMGSLPGWWVGAESGRPNGPGLSLPQWDTLLRKSGFGGVETCTPPLHKLYVSTIFAAQAVDDRVSLLRSPLHALSTGAFPPADTERLVIVGGETLATHRIAEQLAVDLSSRYTSIVRVSSFETLDDEKILPSSTVLSLAELDEPVFQAFTPAKFDAFKTVWGQAGTILWVTRGARAEEAHSFMTVGIGRVMKFEYPNISLQVLDFDKLDDKTPHVIAEELLRLDVLKNWEKELRGDELLWSLEPEVFIESGTRMIPRLYECEQANARYNSARRTITREVNPQESGILFASNGTSYELQHPSPLRIANPPPALGQTRALHVSHFLLQTIGVGSVGNLMLCAGTDEVTGEQLLALSHSTESRAKVLADWTVPLEGLDPVKALAAVAAHITASNILQLAPSRSTLVIHEPDQLVGSVLARKCEQYSINLVITTSLKSQVPKGWLQIHGNLPRRLVKRALPASPAVFVDLSQARGSAEVGRLIAKCIPQLCITYGTTRFYGTTTEIRPGFSTGEVTETLKEAWLVAKKNLDQLEPPDVMELQDLSNFSILESPLTVANCSKSAVSVKIQPIDTGVIFQADKTYFLVGLAGEVGQSLCQWMVEHGARYLALTSRRPKVHPKFIQSMEAMGATVKVLPLDITKSESLYKCYGEISKTMPPVAGVANGAMVLEDSLFDSMSYEVLTKVLDPKVIGTQLLDDLFHDDTLDFFIAFSSITGVVGNSGQSNYIAANMFMTALAQQRKKRGVPGSAIAISSLMGIGYVERSEELTGDYFKKVGYRNISEQDLHQLFAEAIVNGRPDCSDSQEIVSGLEPLYADTQVKAQFRDDIRFNHFIMERPGTQTYGGKLSTVPVRVQLAEAKTKSEACAIIKESFLVRLKRILMISQDDSVSDKASLVEQGVDSLMAVEVRSWFLKELEVDIPVLKILGGSSITNLLTEAMERVPISVANLDALPDSEKPSTQTQKPAPESPTIEVQGSSTEASSHHSSSPKEGISRVATPATPATPLETPMTEVEGFTLGTPINGKIVAPPSAMDIKARIEKEEISPMSYGQARFWFLNDYLADKRSFDMTVMFKLTGKMNVSRMERAVRTVVQRHEALRTRFFWSGEGDQRVAMQGVLADSPIQLVHKRVPSDAAAKEELKKMHDHVWDLNSWEAVKIHLITVTDNTHYLLVGGHHISWDGYSFTVLFVDLEAAYSGKPLPRLGPESQYPAFAKWQREQYETGAMHKAIESWRSVIDPDTPPMPLFPFAKSPTRPVLDHFSQHEAKATLPPNVVSKLKQLSRKHRATMFHLYLAALKALTWKLLPEIGDHYIGVADANRIDKKFMGSLGFFLNLLPVPFSRGGPRTKISDLIKDARDKAYATLERSIVPWNVILKELKIPRSNTCAPIFQLFVDYRQIVQDRSTWGGCKMSDEDWLNARNGYDLTLGITDNPTGESLLSLRLQANVYDMESTQLLLRSYVNVLETFANGIDLNANDIPCWAPSDIEKTLEVGKGPSMKLEWPTVSHRVDQMITEHGTEPALKDGLGNSLTYGQMGDRINTIAATLIAAGATTGSPIAVFQDPSADWMCSMLAILRVGATYIPLDLRNSIFRLISVVKDAQPTILLTDSNTTAKTKLLGADQAVEIVVSDIPTLATTAPVPNRAEPGSIAIILFTSGTTGKPKGIRLTHDNIRAQCEGYSRFCDIPSKAAVVLQQTIYSFDVSLDQIFAALADGGCLIIVPAHKRGDPQAITEIMVNEGVTYTVSTPSEYEMWFRYAHENLAKCTEWRAAFGGGEHLHRGLIQEFADLALPGLRLFNNYGPTEASLAITKGEVKYNDRDLEDHVPAGFIEPNYTVAIVDEHLRPVPFGVFGEIVAGGPGVAAGYLNLDDMTKEKFISGDKIYPSASKGTWYRTGDRGRLRENGALYVDGRILGDSQVKIRGFRVELGEIEVVLLETAKGALSHAVVTARGTGEDRFLAAHVVFAPDYPQDRRQDMINHLETRLPLPPYMQPAIVVALGNIPVTSNFKFDRKAIQALPLPQANPDDMAFVTEIEKKLAELWQSMIPNGIRELTPETDFFDVGGNSILLVKLQSAVKRTMNATPRLVDFMERSTLGGMAKVIKGSSGVSGIDWEAETSIPESLIELKNERKPRPVATVNRTVILAGATGYLGRHLLPRLVESPQIGQIYCLVQDEGHAATSLSPSPKVRFIHADLSQPNLGLSPAVFGALSDKAHVVINCAANRSFWDGYEAMRPVNFNAVKELTRLCLSNNASFHMLSSGAVEIYDDAAPPTDGSDGYVASKWAAEAFLRKAATNLSLPVYLHRPLPTPANGSGKPSTVSSQAILKELLKITRALGKRPDFTVVSGHLDMAPVADVADDMVASMAGAVEQSGSVEVIAHNARLRVHVKDFADHVENDRDLKALPAMNPLFWFRDAKLAGFGHFILSQYLVMGTEDGELVARR